MRTCWECREGFLDFNWNSLIFFNGIGPSTRPCTCHWRFFKWFVQNSESTEGKLWHWPPFPSFQVLAIHLSIWIVFGVKGKLPEIPEPIGCSAWSSSDVLADSPLDRRNIGSSTSFTVGSCSYEACNASRSQKHKPFMDSYLNSYCPWLFAPWNATRIMQFALCSLHLLVWKHGPWVGSSRIAPLTLQLSLKLRCPWLTMLNLMETFAGSMFTRW